MNSQTFEQAEKFYNENKYLCQFILNKRQKNLYFPLTYMSIGYIL